MSLETIQAPTGYRFKQVDERTVMLEPEPLKVVTIDGLMWSAEDVVPKSCNQAKAEQACKDLRLGGFDDWRLPTIKELLTLVDYDRHSPAIDTDKFPTCKNAWYWTSTPYAPSSSDYAWVVNFYNGYANYDNRGYDYALARAVRSVAPGQ